jgi:hypothetical protein
MLISLSSCRTDFETVASTGDLEFSKDTVYLDTVFKNIGSSTYNLKVYNRSNKDITIPSIKLENGLNSKFRMTIDGMQGNQGKAFDNVTLLAKDSLYIFIETTAETTDGTALPEDENKYIYTDEINFVSVGKTQKVELVTIIQDVIFLYPPKDANGKPETLLLGVDKNDKEIRINGFELNDNYLEFTNKTPYVIYGYAAVNNNKTLIIKEGARVYFHSNSGLVIDNGSTLKIEGKLDDTNSKGEIINRREVTFEGDRLEPEFEDTPGQWGTIWMREGSYGSIDHLTLKNATVGLLINNSNLSISNSQIYNSANVGILARNSTITGNNLVVNNCGEASLACTYGGDYNFTHCTFNNNWNSTSQVAVLVNNYILGANPGAKPLGANFKNCIIYGSNNVELFLDKNTSATFNTSFENCLVKFNDENNSISSDLYEDIRKPEKGNKKNIDPKFKNSNKNQLNIMVGSGAIGNAKLITPNFSDILNNPRPTLTSSSNDIGAYQFIAIP